MASRQRYTAQEYRQKADAAGRPLFARDGTPILEPATAVEPVTAAKSPRNRGLLIGAGAVLGLIVLVLVVLASVDAPGSGGDRYTQTWSTPYASTTCADWTSRMSQGQRFAGASDIVSELRRASGTVPSANYRPADQVISTFQAGISSACTLSPAGPLLSAATLVFQLDPGYAS